MQEMMLKSLQQKFSEEETKKFFEMSEFQYENKIKETFSNIKEENINSNDLYTNFFRSFSEQSKENSKLCSKLKHE
jgi:hypothetical protein